MNNETRFIRFELELLLSRQIDLLDIFVVWSVKKFEEIFAEK